MPKTTHLAKGPRMAKSIALADDASRPASLLLSYIPAVCAFVAPRHPGASTAIIDRLSHSRALRARRKIIHLIFAMKEIFLGGR
jgi:hypothetical protein